MLDNNAQRKTDFDLVSYTYISRIAASQVLQSGMAGKFIFHSSHLRTMPPIASAFPPTPDNIFFSEDLYSSVTSKKLSDYSAMKKIG